LALERLLGRARRRTPVRAAASGRVAITAFADASDISMGQWRPVVSGAFSRVLFVSAACTTCIRLQGPMLAAGAGETPATPPLVPKWTPTYNMSLSTILQPCNYSGLYDYDAYPSLARFGVVDFDWSNAKRTWINHSPMDCDAMLAEQAARNTAKNPAARVFVYRNIVKALPWYLEVSQLLLDQQYWGFFIPYAGCRTAAGEYVCKNNATGAIDAGANLYHDHEQTPGWTGGELRMTGNGGPDGICHGDTIGNTNKGCDCGGTGVPCGEYLWDHRNQSLTAWLTNSYIGGDTYGLGNENISGFFLDDGWSSHSTSSKCNATMISSCGAARENGGPGKCHECMKNAYASGVLKAAGCDGTTDEDAFCFSISNDLAQPSEEAWPVSPRGTGAGRSAGLTKEESEYIHGNHTRNMAACQAAIVDNGGFNWQLLKTTGTPSASQCAEKIRASCNESSLEQTAAMMYKITYNFTGNYTGVALTQFPMDLGFFLLTRGPYAWLGYGWMGCGCKYDCLGSCDTRQQI
jgi:hypothetical protein